MKWRLSFLVGVALRAPAARVAELPEVPRDAEDGSGGSRSPFSSRSEPTGESSDLLEALVRAMRLASVCLRVVIERSRWYWVNSILRST